jgi:hypothetical protein
MSVAFKEWEVICSALGSGRQSILLRKGGIHEGSEGFSFAHDSFLLFPTKFHAQLDHVREGDFSPGREWQVGDKFSITHYAKALFAVTLDEWSQVEALFPYHVYTPPTLKERFDWEGKGMATGSIHLAFVRVFKLSEPFELTYEKHFGGCRSWLELPDVSERILESSLPVVDEDTFESLHLVLRGILGECLNENQ